MEARLLSEPPAPFKKPKRLKGSRAKGKTYERTVGRKLQRRIDNGLIKAELITEQWFGFKDKNGYGCCQTDIYLIFPSYIILLECKLTQNDQAKDQMLKLYIPILEHIYSKPIIPVQVCKNLHYHPKGLIHDIDELITRPRKGLFTWHYQAQH